MVRYLRTVSFCLLTAFLNYSAYSSTLGGIDIKAMLERFSGVAQTYTLAQQASDVEGNVNLAKILAGHSFPATSTETVGILLKGQKKKIFLIRTMKKRIRKQKQIRWKPGNQGKNLPG